MASPKQKLTRSQRRQEAQAKKDERRRINKERRAAHHEFLHNGPRLQKLGLLLQKYKIIKYLKDKFFGK